MRCKSVLTRIDALRTGELETGEQHKVEEHLENCASCEESVEDIGTLAEMAKGLIAQPVRSCSEAVCSSVREKFAAFEKDGRTIWVVFSDRGVRAIATGEISREEFAARYGSRYGVSLEEGEAPPVVRAAIERVLRGEEPGEIEVDLSGLTEFERAVLAAIRGIPRGEVRPYRWVAEQVGRPNAVRAVGNVMARNPVPLILPCHRVVPNSGGLGNYGWGPALKRSLLSAEGVPVEELDELGRRGVRYVGSKTTHIYCYPTCPDARRIRTDNRLLLHDESEAARLGCRPCKRCRPLARSA